MIFQWAWVSATQAPRIPNSVAGRARFAGRGMPCSACRRAGSHRRWSIKGRIPMMSLTPEATHAIAVILSRPELPEDAGVRIVLELPKRGAPRQRQVAVAALPNRGDEVIERSGARV